ncbi:MAG: hypothetical protein ACD_75C02551G0002 [uncultured bacterium]|nr:MAG: hypothetical protein ACD_75C02551G0002 [uncultured bacterium]
MKRVVHGSEPAGLTRYRDAEPAGTWEQMKNDLHSGGRNAYGDCRRQLIHDQGGLCAYCEIGIHDNDPLQCRVEHFHPKSDISPVYNWALDWNNLLGVCAGGSYARGNSPAHYLPPMRDNLSCDAHKDRMIQSGKLAEHCEGWILNPIQLQASPCLFKLEKSTGKLRPDPETCAVSPAWPGNQHLNLQTLVQHTIDMLNLNCDRLSEARRRIIWDIESNKKKQRLRGYSPEQGLRNLVEHFLRKEWPEFFTTIRLCLGRAAERYLAATHYRG